MSGTRQEVLDGLTQMVEFFRTHPDIPFHFQSPVNIYVGTKENLAQVARDLASMGLTKKWSDYALALRLSFGPIAVDWFLERTQVCRKVLKGTRVIPARPEQTVEDYDWICDEPLLAGNGESIAGEPNPYLEERHEGERERVEIGARVMDEYDPLLRFP